MVSPTKFKFSFSKILSVLNDERISMTIEKRGNYNYYLLFYDGLLVFEGNRRELEKALKFYLSIKELKNLKEV